MLPDTGRAGTRRGEKEEEEGQRWCAAWQTGLERGRGRLLVECGQVRENVK